MLNKYGKWYADWRDENGKRHAKAFPTKKAAARYSEKMSAAAAAKKRGAQHHRSDNHRWAEAAPTEDRHTPRIARELKAAIGHQRPADLREETILGILARWRERYARNTVHHRAAPWLLKKLLRAIEADGGTSLNIPKQPGYRPRKRTAKGEETAKLLGIAPPGMKLFILLACTLGLRFTEAITVKPSGWDREKHLLTFRRKGRDEHQLPTTPEIEALLAVAPDHGDPEESFVSRLVPATHHGKSVPWRVRNAWIALKKEANVSKDLGPHDLRRTAATALYELTHDLLLVQELLGHANIATTARYIQHADSAALRPLIAQMWHPTPKAVQ